MNRFCQAVAWVAIASGLNAAPPDLNTVVPLLAKGRGLSVAEAEDLEARLRKTPEDAVVRIQLLAYYTSVPKDLGIAKVREARAHHILWLIEQDPETAVALSKAGTGVHRLHCGGDELADPAAFRQASLLWVQQAGKRAADASIRNEAAAEVEYCAPDLAEKLLKEAQDEAGLGSLYANAVLGVTGETYQYHDPEGTDAALRQSPFARRALAVLESSADRELLVGATRTLLGRGALLWADGKLDWDYTALGHDLLAKAKQADPGDFDLLTLPTGLPARGVRPPRSIRVGGNVMQSMRQRGPAPSYPASARDQGIEGTVKLAALIGLDGKVLGLNVVSGPPELVSSALEAVRQWEYRPTLVNGMPCYVLTQIDLNYTLGTRRRP
jgi:TonB family protein